MCFKVDPSHPSSRSCNNLTHYRIQNRKQTRFNDLFHDAVQGASHLTHLCLVLLVLLLSDIAHDGIQIVRVLVNIETVINPRNPRPCVLFEGS